jgi:hypothetical protein
MASGLSKQPGGVCQLVERKITLTGDFLGKSPKDPQRAEPGGSSTRLRPGPLADAGASLGSLPIRDGTILPDATHQSARGGASDSL